MPRSLWESRAKLRKRASAICQMAANVGRRTKHLNKLWTEREKCTETAITIATGVLCRELSLQIPKSKKSRQKKLKRRYVALMCQAPTMGIQGGQCGTTEQCENDVPRLRFKIININKVPALFRQQPRSIQDVACQGSNVAIEGNHASGEGTNNFQDAHHILWVITTTCCCIE